MRRLYLLFLMFSLVVSNLAQTQKGFIRTICRPDRASKPVAEVTILVSEGNKSVLSNTKGEFSFPCRSESYRIMRVQKTGFQLVDKGVVGRLNPYSAKVAQEIVMVSQADLNADKMRIEEKANKRAQADYQKRLDAIKRELEEKRITEQQAIQAEAAAGDSFQNYIKMIDDMAERYAMMDYEGISDKNRQIFRYIEDAEFEKADSLIKSKGDIEARIKEVKELQKVTEATENLALKMREKYTSNINDLAEDLYSKFTIYKSKFQNDSAAYCLEQRVALDTTNVEWKNDAGMFIKNYVAHYDKALTYFELALHQSLIQYGEQSEWYANCIGNIGAIYSDIGNYEKALEYYNMALRIQEKVLGSEHRHVATSYNNIGLVYTFQGNYDQALELYGKAINIHEKALDLDTPDMASLYSNMGLAYADKGDSEKAIENLSKALTIWENTLGKEHPDVATSYDNIGTVYADLGLYDKALEYCNKALTIRKKIIGNYHPSIAYSYNNIGSIYSGQDEYDKALEYQTKALSIWENSLGSKHSVVATAYKNIAYLYFKKGDNSKSLECYFQALSISENSFGTMHPDVASIYNNIGIVYYKQSDYSKALDYLSKALAIYENILGPDHSKLQTVKDNIEDVKRKLAEAEGN